MSIRVEAEPTKEFFVYMITRDIDLTDAILDLLDNSIDGARRQQKLEGTQFSLVAEDLSGYEAKINFSRGNFEIVDNCGGMSIDTAINYAFRFGRRPDFPEELESTIGLYGIGMKRAILKMGKRITIRSSTETEAFEIVFDVEEWLGRKDWELNLTEETPWDVPGTRILVEDLYDGVSSKFVDNAFISELIKIVARDYSFIIETDFAIDINRKNIAPFSYQVKESEKIKPSKAIYNERAGVTVEISTGMAEAPPIDSSAEYLNEQKIKDIEYYGWFVVCNNRVVLAADKSDRTIWGDENFTKWHPQYNGFIGLVKFFAEDPDLLPWTTTKRDIDESNPLYQRAVAKMKEATRPWIEYTGERKRDLEEAKKIESATSTTRVGNITPRPKMELPEISTLQESVANIHYQVTLDEVDKVRKQLGNKRLPYTEVGRKTFQYFYDHEVEE